MLTHPKQPKKTTTSAKPRFSGPEPGFGPDVVIFGCFGKGLYKPREPGFGPEVVIFVLILLGEVHTKRDHIWPKPMAVGSEPGVWAGCVHFKSVLVGKADGIMSIAGSFWVPTLRLDRPHVPSAWRRVAGPCRQA